MKLTAFFLALGAASGALVGPGGEETDPLPDILVVVGDDLGWEDVTPSVPTPNIERLMQAGVTYRGAYSMPICLPTRYTLFFGRYGRRDGIDDLAAHQPVSPSNPRKEIVERFGQGRMSKDGLT